MKASEPLELERSDALERISAVLGLPFEAAVSRLISDGFSVLSNEARSLKGVSGGDSRRVIRARLVDSDGAGRTVQLVFSDFKTGVSDQ